MQHGAVRSTKLQQISEKAVFLPKIHPSFFLARRLLYIMRASRKMLQNKGIR